MIAPSFGATFFLHILYLHCLIYRNLNLSQFFLVNQIVLHLITHWFTQYLDKCWRLVGEYMLSISEIQQWAMAEWNRMFIKFNFLNIYCFASNQTRS